MRKLLSDMSMFKLRQAHLYWHKALSLASAFTLKLLLANLKCIQHRQTDKVGHLCRRLHDNILLANCAKSVKLVNLFTFNCYQVNALAFVRHEYA